MRTDIRARRSVIALEKIGIPQDLPTNYRINSRSYGKGSLNTITGHIVCVLENKGYEGRIFKEKNHKFAILEEEAAKALEKACNSFSTRDYQKD